MHKDITTIQDEHADKRLVSLNLQVTIWEEAGLFYAENEALQLLGYGHTIDEAKLSFQEVVKEYFEYTISNGTLEQDLMEHGFEKVNGQIVDVNPQREIKPKALHQHEPIELLNHQILIPCQ